MMKPTDVPIYTLAEGQPRPDPSAALQIASAEGAGGLSVLSDTQLIETLAHFARERIPERSVHAKAAGAWGEFEVLHDISDLTDAKFLSTVGKKTPVLSRISTVGGEKGSSDTVRDVRGFNDLPVFFIRDPIKFPSMNRSHKRDPRINIPTSSMFWDFHVNNQEGIHALMHLFGQRGIPASLRHINGFGVHTYTLCKEDGSFKYIKWHLKPDAGIECLSAEKALHLAGEDPDYHVKDMFNAIERGNYPSWTLYIQVMDPKHVSSAPIPIFDCTYTWPHHQYPLRPVGRLTLNKNPDNYFQDIEQACFSPSNMVPGVGPSADLVLQARMFSYPDAARYRVGPNYQQLPCNRALAPVYSPYERDGPGTINGNYGGDPDYVRSGFRKVRYTRYQQAANPEHWQGQVQSYSSQVTNTDFVQARDLWKIICQEKSGAQEFMDNIKPTLKDITPELHMQVVEMFNRVDEKLGGLLAAAAK